MPRQIMVPLEKVHVLKVSSLEEWREARRRAEPGYKPKLVVHKSACELFGLQAVSMRSALGLEA